VRVGSFSNLDKILPHNILKRAASPLPLLRAASEPKIDYWFDQIYTLDDFPARQRITETEIADIVEAYLKEKTSGQASIKELVHVIPDRVALSEEDLAQSTTRRNEALWEQQVRNITSHQGSPGNAIFEGKLVAVPGGLALTGKEAAA
jgi:hypothetical protein